MALLIQPVIASRAEFAKYFGLNAAALAGIIGDGVTTFGGYIDSCLAETAWLIKEWCDFDYTAGQTVTLSGIGNDRYDIDVPMLLDTIVYFGRYPVDSNPIATIQALSNASIVSQSGRLKLFIANGNADKLTTFDSNYFWLVRYTTQAYQSQQYPPQYGSVTTGSWPEPLKQIQIEMISVRIRESAIGWGGGVTPASSAAFNLGMAGSYPLDNTIHAVKFIDMMPKWQQRCMPYRKMSI